MGHDSWRHHHGIDLIIAKFSSLVTESKGAFGEYLRKDTKHVRLTNWPSDRYVSIWCNIIPIRCINIKLAPTNMILYSHNLILIVKSGLKQLWIDTACDKLDRICQVGFVGAWHWPVSGRVDAYCDVFMYVHVCTRVNSVPDLVCVMEACLIRVICVSCGIWNLEIYKLLRFSGACNVCPSCVLWLDPSLALVMSVSKWGC